MAPFIEDNNKTPVYNVDYFIAKFRDIPEDAFAVAEFTDPTGARHCALGHCGARDGFPKTEWTDESRALYDLAPQIMTVNDSQYVIVEGERVNLDKQPKAAVLAYLQFIKEGRV